MGPRVLGPERKGRKALHGSTVGPWGRKRHGAFRGQREVKGGAKDRHVGGGSWGFGTESVGARGARQNPAQMGRGGKGCEKGWCQFAMSRRSRANWWG